MLKSSSSSSSLFANSILLLRWKSMSELTKTHALVITLGLSEEEPFASRALSFSALSPSGNTDYAYRFLTRLSNPPKFSWNFVIRGFSNSKTPEKTIHAYIQMLRNGFSPDHMTYPFLIKSTSRLLNRGIGGSLHSSVLKNGFVWDLYICNSLIHMYGSLRDSVSARKVFDEMPDKNLVTWNSILDGYAKCGDVVSARRVFDEMTERDVVSWSSMVDGYVKSGEYDEALEVFDEMMRVSNVKGNEVTMVSVLCACAHLGALSRGKAVHRYIVDKCLPLTVMLQTSLIDMYAKCGSIGDAWGVFCGVSVEETDVLMWNAMIGGLASHGFIRESLQLFYKMQESEFEPDEITFLCLLAACSHGGLVKEAWYLFRRLKKSGAEPKSEHYACMVDVLSRAGLVKDAYGFISEMPMKPTGSMLGALLNGCINHGNWELAEMVGKKLVVLQPDNDGRYVGLANVYAINKRFGAARSMRESMDKKGVKKVAGHSIIDLDGTQYRFIAHDKTHLESEKIYTALHLVGTWMDLSVDSDFNENYNCICS
ncbi:unnamed protein product [Eruca vesicaria subsp. sativa]|uniref:Pentatricopeptide repeat-containing protein n=1 Tax=Eruca vesicaria subsp. sativa TaxID=29727 RepID=A0ABC8J8L2_ERUVS|nr:unnamed protein product [Eruca vesicaria subsp. sativa]